MLNCSFKEVCILSSIACGTEGILMRAEDTTQKRTERSWNTEEIKRPQGRARLIPALYFSER